MEFSYICRAITIKELKRDGTTEIINSNYNDNCFFGIVVGDTGFDVRCGNVLYEDSLDKDTGWCCWRFMALISKALDNVYRRKFLSVPL